MVAVTSVVMTGHVTVSIVMPAYNAARYLPEGLDSLQAQSMSAFELIVVDDGSTDATRDIVARYQATDARIRLLTQPHRGVTAALNHGLAAASAPLVARMDADDVALPDRLACQVAFLAANPDVTVLGTAVALIDAAGREIGHRRYPCQSGDIVRALRDGDNVIAHPTVMFRRAAVLAAGGYRERFRHAQDYDLWLRIADAGTLANFSMPLLRYRVHGSGVGKRHRIDQILDSRAATMVARLRRERHPDPTEAFTAFSAADIAHLPFTRRERTAMMLDVVAFALASHRVEAAATPDMIAITQALVSPARMESCGDVATALLADVATFAASRNSAEHLLALTLRAIRAGRYRLGLYWMAQALRLHPLGLPILVRMVAGRWLHAFRDRPG